jgi:hypothetical protein
MAIAADADRVLRDERMIGGSDSRVSAQPLVLANHVAPHS